MNAHNEQQAAIKAMNAAQPAAAQEAVVWQWRCPRADTGWSDCDKSLYDELRKAIGGEAGEMNGLRYEVRALYAAPVAPGTAAPAGNRTSVDSGALTLALNVLRRAGKDEVADALEATAVRGTPAAPGIDLLNELIAAIKSYRLSASTTNRASIERLDDVLARIDASPKGALPALPDDFSESKDWQAGGYAERVEWLIDTVRSQREHIDTLMDNPKGALNEQFGSAEGLGSPEARDAARWRAVDAAGSGVTLRLHSARPGERAKVIDAAMAAQASDGMSLNDLPSMWEKADLIGGATDVDDSPKGDDVAGTLRLLLDERNHRTDGDLKTLAARCLHLSRGDRDLIAMRGAIIEKLQQRIAKDSPKGGSDEAAWSAGYRAAINAAAAGVQELYRNHVHHTGSDGLIARAMELEQSFIRDAAMQAQAGDAEVQP